MKILALEKELPGATTEQFQQHGKAEALRAWELYQQGVIRELYFRQDRSEAVLMLECDDEVEAEAVLQTLPLVKAGLISFELIPLVAYSGFAHLFEKTAWWAHTQVRPLLLDYFNAIWISRWMAGKCEMPVQ